MKTETAPYISETKVVGDVRVHKASIAGTRNLIVYAAYEPSSYFGPHSSLMTLDGQTCGSLPSRRLTPELDALPAMTEVRFRAVDAYHQKNCEEAYQAIVAAYPEAKDGRRRAGEIEMGEW
jgi:hypothetical protein